MNYTQTEMSVTLGLALVGMAISYFLGRLSKKKPKVETSRFVAKEELTVQYKLADWDYAARSK